jgi:hypothetical protein
MKRGSDFEGSRETKIRSPQAKHNRAKILICFQSAQRSTIAQTSSIGKELPVRSIAQEHCSKDVSSLSRNSSEHISSGAPPSSSQSTYPDLDKFKHMAEDAILRVSLHPITSSQVSRTSPEISRGKYQTQNQSISSTSSSTSDSRAHPFKASKSPAKQMPQSRKLSQLEKSARSQSFGPRISELEIHKRGQTPSCQEPHNSVTVTNTSTASESHGTLQPKTRAKAKSSPHQSVASISIFQRRDSILQRRTELQ